jgi:hypothetical protein
MKRYLLFGGDHYYPFGGWEDFAEDFSSVESAKKYTENHFKDWWHIVDGKNKKIVHTLSNSAWGKWE